ncbi:unnamed protein product [Gadus morhua 'NCC']
MPPPVFESNRSGLWESGKSWEVSDSFHDVSTLSVHQDVDRQAGRGQLTAWFMSSPSRASLAGPCLPPPPPVGPSPSRPHLSGAPDGWVGGPTTDHKVPSPAGIGGRGR